MQLLGEQKQKEASKLLGRINTNIMIRFCDELPKKDTKVLSTGVTVTGGECSLFSNIHSLLDECNANILVPIVDTDGKEIGFAYDDASLMGAWMYYMETLGHFIQTAVNPDIFHVLKCDLVDIHDMNELSYKFMNCCRHHNVAYLTTGKYWEFIGISKNESINDSSNSIYRIDAEGTGSESAYGGVSLQIFSNFRFLETIEPAVGFKPYLEKYWDEFLMDNFNTILLAIPELEDIVALTDVQKETLRLREAYGDRCYLEKGIIERVHGKRTADYFKDAENKIIDYREHVLLYEGRCGTPVYGFKEAVERNRIFLIGPCIVAGRENLEEDTLSYRLYQKVKKFDYQVLRIPLNIIFLPEKMAILKDLPIREKDIFIFANYRSAYDGYNLGKFDYVVNTLKLFNSIAGEETLFSDEPVHTNAEGNERIANLLINGALSELIAVLSKKSTNHYT